MNKISVLGSINMDINILLDRLPSVGETVHGNERKISPGGKGLNQAIACSRFGTDTYFIGKVGNDENGKYLCSLLNSENINIDFLSTTGSETGEAWILVQKNGKNMIVLNSGANRKINHEDIKKAENIITQSDAIISQLEVPQDSIISAFKIARSNSVVTILNPAPALEMKNELLTLTDILIPNETEFNMLVGETDFDNKNDLKHKCNMLFEKGIKYIIITLGEKGSLICGHEFMENIEAIKVTAKDTTAAGDSFIGAFTACLSKNLNHNNIIESVRIANIFASYVVQREGAFLSIPSKEDIKDILSQFYNEINSEKMSRSL